MSLPGGLQGAGGAGGAGGVALRPENKCDRRCDAFVATVPCQRRHRLPGKALVPCGKRRRSLVLLLHSSSLEMRLEMGPEYL